MSIDTPGDENEIEYDPEAETYRTTFDSRGTDPSVEVVYALAEACDTDPTKLEPLSDVIDPQALDQLCRGQNCDSDGTVVFNYHRHKVRIESYGVIEVQPLQ